MSFNVSCLLLGAGQSSRMGGLNKLLLEYQGKALINHLADTIQGVGFQEVVFVSGHEREKTESKITKYPFKIVFNPEFQSGMHGSIQAGLKVLEPCAAFMICLSDQPFLRADDLKTLCEAFVAHPEAKLVCPIYEGRRGNPVVISWSLRAEILAHPHSEKGCQYLFERYPTSVIKVPMPNRAALIDIDTMEQYTALLQGTNGLNSK